MYGSQITEGTPYLNLQPVIIINLLDYIVWKKLEKAHSCFMLMEKDIVEYALTDDLIIHYIEAPKLERWGGKLLTGAMPVD